LRPELESSAPSGRRSNRARAEEFRRQGFKRVGEKYDGLLGERFGPTLAGEASGFGTTPSNPALTE